MPNPIRNHLEPPGFGSKVGERMDATSRHLCEEIKRVCLEYQQGLTLATQALRELDNVQALCSQRGTVLPAERLDWEGSEVDQWIPGQKD